jgi:hypothetical protein
MTLEMAFAAYSTNWFEASLTRRKLILIIMIRSQQGEPTFAMKLMKVNLETYQWVSFFIKF